jgi:hypothetical protein
MAGTDIAILSACKIMRKNRFLPLLIPLITGGMLELLYFWPSAIYSAAAVTIIIFLFAIRQLLCSGSKRERWWNLAILPAMFTLSVIAFSVILPRSLVQPFFLFDVIFLYLYFRAVYYYLHFSSPVAIRNNGESLLNLSIYGNFLAVYFMSSSVYGLQVFLGIKAWLLMLIIFVAFELIVYQVLWANRIDVRRSSIFILLAGFVLVESGWTASFLPLSYYILGLVLAICYYMIIGLTRFYLAGALDRRTVKKYLIFGFFSLITVMLSARWL